MASMTILRRSASELLSYALVELFPGVLLIEAGITEFGFYCDIIAEHPIDAKVIDLVDEKMRGMIKHDFHVRVREMMRENAAALLEHKGQPLRAQAALDTRQNVVQVIQLDEFYDYCAFPCVQSTGDIESVKILAVEPIQAYFQEEGHVPAIRVRGAVFPGKDGLKKMIKSYAAGKKRDHRTIARELDLFTQYDHANILSYSWHPHGAELRNSLEQLWRKEHRLQGFDFLISPSLVQESFIIQSGFFDHWAEPVDTHASLFEGAKYCIPPSLAPLHALVFSSKPRFHWELPVRFAECAQLQMLGKNDALWGILNCKLAYSDRAFIFCSPAQIEEEVISFLQFIDKFIKIFGFEYHWCLEGRQQNTGHSSSRWRKAEASLISAFRTAGLEYGEVGGEEVCQGPFAQAVLIDSVGREWEGPRIGVDLTCPARFGLCYSGSDGKDCAPVMLERTLYGTFERFAAILAEHYAGQFPLWLAPEQVRVIPVSEDNTAYAAGVCREIVENGFRGRVELSQGSLGSKVHNAEKEKIPYMIIIGDKEEKQRTITVRSRSCKAAEKRTVINEFLAQLQQEVAQQRRL